MFRAATRIRLNAIRTPLTALSTKRTLLTATRPTVSSRFRSAALRWGLAGGLVYYYNTSPIFADEPADKQPHLSRAPPVVIEEENPLPTLDEIREEARRKKEAAPKTETERVLTEPRSPESIEEEAEQQGAFNEETGEINWDCPCLGGMAHGPCGDDFRKAFSCFVFSKEEPKGVDCIENFKGMQECFAKYPEIYGSPQDDDEIENEIDEKLDTMQRETDASTPTSEHPAPIDQGISDTTGISRPAPGKSGAGSDLGLGHPAPSEGPGSNVGLPSPTSPPSVSGPLH